MTRVLLVGGTVASRRLLRQALEAERDIAVVRELDESAAVMSVLPSVEPDVVALDESMLSAAGLTIIERIMSEAPLPVVVLSELFPDPSAEKVRQATRRGALGVLAKPTQSDLAGAAVLRASVRRLAKIPVVRHPRGRSAPPSLHHVSAHPTPPQGHPVFALEPLVEIVGIGSSAGGPAVLSAILGELPKTFAACVLVVQHLPAGFAQPFASFLQAHSQLPVVVAREPLPMTPGHVILAPDNAHLVVKSRGQCVTLDGPLVNGHRPSVDNLLESMARVYRSAALGVILSGIGSDGTAGLRAIREHGGLTIAQDAQSAAVNGMPRSASESGAAELVLSPAAIVQTLLRVCAPAPRVVGGHGS